jgi:DNA-binding MarR family transcriptional regulator
LTELSQLTSRAHTSSFLANHLARLVNQKLAEALHPVGLAPAQYMVLVELWKAEPLTQAELVHRLNVEQATMNNTLKRMERDRLITRQPHPVDRRAQVIYAAPRAMKLKAAALERANALQQAAVADLSPSEQERMNELMNSAISALRVWEPVPAAV